MKALALIALLAVPRTAMEAIAAQMTRFSWRALLRASLRVMATLTLAGFCLIPLGFVLIFGGNQ